MILHVIVEQEVEFWIYVNLYGHILNPNLAPFYCQSNFPKIHINLRFSMRPAFERRLGNCM